MNENLAQAQGVIRDTLNEKLNAALDEKFEAYAPAIFEENEKLDSPLGKQDGDINNNNIPDSDKDKDPSGFYLQNRRDAIGAAIEGEEEDEDEDEDEEDDMSDQQLQSDENYQDMPSSEKAAMKRDTTYPSAPRSDGY